MQKSNISASILLGTFFSGIGNGGVTCAASNVSSADADQGTASGYERITEFTDVYSDNNIKGVKYKISLDADSYEVSLSIWQEETNSFVPALFHPRENVRRMVAIIKKTDKEIRESKSQSDIENKLQYRSCCVRALGDEVATSYFYPYIDELSVADHIRFFIRDNTVLVVVIVYFLIIGIGFTIIKYICNRKKPAKSKVVHKEDTKKSEISMESLAEAQVIN